MGLGNLLEAVVNHLLIRGMGSHDYRDEVFMVSVLAYMVIHWIRPTVSQDLRISSNHNLTKLLHYVFSQPLETIELMLKLVVTLTYG